MITLIIAGKPIAKARPRFYRRGKHVGTYNSQETEEGRFMLECQSQLKGYTLPTLPTTRPVSLYVRFEMPIPKSYSKKKRQAITDGSLQHVKRPDLDNMLKFIKDCLNGLAWRDDSQVISVNMAKEYAAEPKTVILLDIV